MGDKILTLTQHSEEMEGKMFYVGHVTTEEGKGKARRGKE